MEARHTMRKVLWGVGIIIVVGYSAFVLEGFVRGPVIILDEPTSTAPVTTPLLHLSGTVLRTTNFSINDMPILLDTEGGFREDVLLGRGYNIITMTAWDRYERKKERVIELMFTPPPEEEQVVSEEAGTLSEEE